MLTLEHILPDTMTRAANWVRDGDIDVSRTNGDAIITSADHEARNVDVTAVTDVDAIGVRAISRRSDPQVPNSDRIAPLDGHVKALAITQRQIGYVSIRDLNETKCLQQNLYSGMVLESDNAM